MKKLSRKDFELYDETIYETWVKIKGVKEEMEFLLDTGSEDEKKLQKMIDFANKFLEWIVKNDLEVKKYACKKLLKLKNKTWLEAKEKPVTEKEFIKRIKLSSIFINADKSAALTYDADEMFTDHAILIDLSKNQKLTDAYL
ncbi:DUF2262 domain-containing protein [Candidatus Peregrinibacteria bacterium]|nr:DUF2262 domain-containing protein [Candidatus Peregrinibacteria bacterium]